MKRGIIFIISAPSGTGKSTLVDDVLKHFKDKMLVRVITCTTRMPRPKEKEGVDYIFLSKEEFQKRKERGDFLETIQLFEHEYGTLRESVNKALSDHNVILLLDVKGAINLIEEKDETIVSIFIMPPNDKELERRIRSRKQDDEHQIDLRLKKAKSEMEKKNLYDYIVINDDFNQASLSIRDIIMKEIRKHGENNG